MSESRPAPPRKPRGPAVYTDYTDPIPDALLSAIREERCLALIGSGLSRRCLSKLRRPLPDWPELLRNLISWAAGQTLVSVDDARDLEQLIERRELIMVGQELKERTGAHGLGRFVADVFDPDSIVPSRVHDLMSVLPFRGFLTTNYDNLLERGYMRVWKRQMEWGLSADSDHVEKLLNRKPFLLKLHGDIHTPESLILGHRDFLRLMGEPEYDSLLNKLVSSYALLIIGHGLRDSDIAQSLDRTAGALAPPAIHVISSGCQERDRTQAPAL